MTVHLMNARTTIIDALDSERRWQANRPDADDSMTPFMPFEMFAFIALLAEAMPPIRGDRFLDIGCGPGSKLMIAKDLFGLNAHGFDISKPLVEFACQNKLNAEVADARDYGHYADADLIWFNRPFRDRAVQADLEHMVWGEMSPGAVVICANLENPPPPSWGLILDDWEIRRGIFQKPIPAPGVKTT